MKQVEVEGGELALKNSFGDIVIIPKKNRLEVEGMIKDKCWGCVDAFVDTLPIMEDYAEDGSLFPGWDTVKTVLNPYNWGVTDYTDKLPDKDKAFAAARKAGEKEYLYKGVRYPVVLKNLPGEIIKERDDFKGNWISKTPREFDRGYGELNDLYKYYFGQPLEHSALRISKYKPKNSKDENVDYIAIKNDEFEKSVIDKYNAYFENNNSLPIYEGEESYRNWKKVNDNTIQVSDYGNSTDGSIDEPNTSTKGEALGRYFISKGEDERGEYVSYYDEFNRLSGKSGSKALNDRVGATKAFEVYDRLYIKDYGDGQKKRMYYSDKELSELDINKKNFDTLALQRELSNRGYKLPKSTKKDGTFDGIWGDETKAALLDYQTKNNPKNIFNTNDLKLYYPYSEKSNKYKIQELQKTLSEKGYKLPKSTKKDGTFDGIWGDETKAALLDYQTKNKKNEYKPYTAVQDNTYVVPKVIIPLEQKKKQQ